jgi:environmental stress-induced protein Ves
VAFPGDIPLTATETEGTRSDDFNVMTARSLARPLVAIVRQGMLPAGGLIALYALGVCRVNGKTVEAGGLVLSNGEVTLPEGGPVIAVRLIGL